LSLRYVDVVMATPMYNDPLGRAQEALRRREEWMFAPPDKYLDGFRDYSCFLTSRELIDKLGKFDENYGAGYGEDIDFAFRVEKAGGIIKSNKRVNTHHIGGATVNTLGSQISRVHNCVL